MGEEAESISQVARPDYSRNGWLFERPELGKQCMKLTSIGTHGLLVHNTGYDDF